MKEFFKKYFKIIIGGAVLVLCLFLFLRANSSSAIEGGNLRDWRGATVERRTSAVRVIVASDDANTEIIVACVDKMATLPDSDEMAVRDAVSLCHTGLLLKANM